MDLLEVLEHLVLLAHLEELERLDKLEEVELRVLQEHLVLTELPDLLVHQVQLV